MKKRSVVQHMILVSGGLSVYIYCIHTWMQRRLDNELIIFTFLYLLTEIGNNSRRWKFHHVCGFLYKKMATNVFQFLFHKLLIVKRIKNFWLAERKLTAVEFERYTVPKWLYIIIIRYWWDLNELVQNYFF